MAIVVPATLDCSRRLDGQQQEAKTFVCSWVSGAWRVHFQKVLFSDCLCQLHSLIYSCQNHYTQFVCKAQHVSTGFVDCWETKSRDNTRHGQVTAKSVTSRSTAVRVLFCVWLSDALSSTRVTKPYSEPIQTVLTTSPNRTWKQPKPYSICTRTKACFLSFSVGLTREIR